MSYNIISMDGGGIRGLITTILLKRINEQVPTLLSNTQLITGTSTGGIIALTLANNVTLDKLIQLYSNGKTIFDKSWLHNLFNLVNINGSEYGNRNLRNGLSTLLGNTKLKDLSKKVLIPSFELDNKDSNPLNRTWKPVFFHNFEGDDSDGDELALDVALATSAAPTYFPSWKQYIDGGVTCNNPSMAAVAQVLDSRAIISPRPDIDSILLLSLGTGQNLQYIEGRDLDWGLVHWIKPLINLMLDGNPGVADYQCRQLLKNNYKRLAPIFPANINIPIDAIGRTQDMIDFANKIDISDTLTWLKNNSW